MDLIRIKPVGILTSAPLQAPREREASLAKPLYKLINVSKYDSMHDLAGLQARLSDLLLLFNFGLSPQVRCY